MFMLGLLHFSTLFDFKIICIYKNHAGIKYEMICAENVQLDLGEKGAPLFAHIFITIFCDVYVFF